jgi:putative CocE/NonD family hydrolase
LSQVALEALRTIAAGTFMYLLTSHTEISRTARILWFLMGLFCLRVLGQVLVEFLHVRFLPPSPEWFSGLIPYPELLASQILVIVLQAKICVDFTRKSGWSYRPRRLAGLLLVPFGAVYLAVMLIRYVVRMALYPHEHWTGGSIPIFFHWVLALFVLSVGYHHLWQSRLEQCAAPRPIQSRWIKWSLRLAAWAACGLGLTAWIVYLLLPSLLAYQLGIRRPEFAVRIERSVPLTAADGISLFADIYHPQRAGPKTPTILVRIPYSKTPTVRLFATVVGQMWAERGYTVVLQGTRGRYESGGEYYPLRGERQDGLDTLYWLARQPWFDGRLGMWGCSYFGYTQWVLADCKDPGPTALMIQESSTDFYAMFHPGGAFSFKSALHWAVLSHGKEDIIPTPDAMERGVADGPLVEADDRAVRDIPFFDDWVRHADRDAYWAGIDGNDRARRLQAPVLLMAGWYDPFLPTQLADYARVRYKADSRIANETRLVIGPWSHAEAAVLPGGGRSRNFRLECLAPTVAWFDRHLLKNPVRDFPPVRIYTIGTGAWRDELEWPLARTRYTPYYLHGNRPANSASGSGILRLSRPKAGEPPDTFIYDPHNPVATAGGAMLGYGAGSARQEEIESRPDILVYSTEPLETDLEVTGPIELLLYVSTTAQCTDFTAKLVDVFPDGSAWNISEGILRRRYDESPHGGTEIKINLWPTSAVFKKGHRVRLEVSSSNYPRFDRNPNTGGIIAIETNSVKAKQTVCHDADSPSRLILPIIPGGNRPNTRTRNNVIRYLISRGVASSRHRLPADSLALPL